MPLFCRHNRLTTSCPICSREGEAQRRPAAPAPARRTGGTSAGRASAPRRARGSSGVVTRKLARPADDGYRNPLVPGLRATADARRLAGALLVAAARLEPPGPYEAVATEPEPEEATWLAFLLALIGPDAPERQAELLALPAEARSWASGTEPEMLTPAEARTARAYRAWAARSGGQIAAYTGDPAWTPQRRFARVLERLSLPGFGRAPRYELLVTLGAAGVFPLEADELHLDGDDDATTLAAKRLLVSGDALLLERRAADLARAVELPLAALDRGLALWGAPRASVDLPAEIPAPVRRALALP